MPKPTQKQRLQKADFSKAKLKLGKGKQAPSNATNTSFKARSIALPGQGVISRALNGGGHAAGEATTAAGLALDEVMIRTRHPNAGVKRDAIQGIKDILVVDPKREAGRVLGTLGALLADEVSAHLMTLRS
jgi:pre-rRNA-processing protein IPI1